MRARWIYLLVAIASATQAHAEPDGACAAACQRMTECKLSTADACATSCKRYGVDGTAAGRQWLATVAQSSCAKVAAMLKPRPQAAQPAQAAPPAQAAQPAQAADPSSDKHQWQCWSEGTYESSRRRPAGRFDQLIWTPSQISAFGFGKTQELARIVANANCSKHMSGMMSIESSNINNQVRVKAECHATRCTPPR